VNEISTNPIQIAFFESHADGIPDGESLPTDTLATFTFDPRQTKSIPTTTLPLRDLPPLVITLSYAANTGGVSLLITHRDRDLLHLGNFIPTNSYVGICLSDDSYLHVHFNRDAPNGSERSA
jgi:hypothetical protein